MKRSYLLVLAIAIALVSLGIAYFSARGTLTVTINTLSPVTEGVSVYIANKHFPQAFTPPFTQRLRPGKYQLIAIASGAEELHQDITIKNDQTTSVSLTLVKDIAFVDQQEITPTAEELATNKFLKLFPHLDTNFKATATYTRNENREIVIKEVTITPYLPIPAGESFDRQAALAAKEQYVNEAKQWLKDNGVPEDTPLVIDSII